MRPGAGGAFVTAAACATAVTADIKSNPVSLGFGGNVTGGKAFRVAGTLDLSVPSIRKAAAWAAEPIEGEALVAAAAAAGERRVDDVRLS